MMKALDSFLKNEGGTLFWKELFSYKAKPSFVKKVSLNSTHFISLKGKSNAQVSKDIKSMTNHHLAQVLNDLPFAPSAKERAINTCRARLFYVRIKDKLVLCGVYRTYTKSDSIGKNAYIESQLYDYLLYSKKSGFFLLCGCSEPTKESDIKQAASPAIYYQSAPNTPFSIIEYGKTYDSKALACIQIKYNIKTFYNDGRSSTHFVALKNATAIYDVDKISLYNEMTSSPNWVVYTKDKNHMGWSVPCQLVNYMDNILYPICCQGGYQFPNSFGKSLSNVLIKRVIKSLQISDEQNLYFYISKANNSAFESIMRCVEKYGSMQKMDNLLDYDGSLNYKISIPKKTPSDVKNFIFGVIYKSKAVYPLLLGCPIHEIVEVLSMNEGDTSPDIKSNIDEMSANNAIALLKRQFKNLPTWKLTNLLVTHYGPYAVASSSDKYWMYYRNEGLRCEYLPSTLETLVGANINGEYVSRLSKDMVDVKWKSEHHLFETVYLYYPDAVMHYHSKWLGYQHLDIFIPCLQIGIEYQGQQHYEVSEFFGGEAGFADRQFLDENKRRLCQQNGITLIEWSYKDTISIANFLAVLSAHGITQYPIPNPNRKPPKQEESIPEEKIALSIRQYDTEGVLINCFKSYQEASEACHISIQTISKAVCGYSRTGGGFQWRRVLEGSPKENIDPLQPIEYTNESKSIVQVSLMGEVVAEYPSITQAEKETGINRKSIRAVLSGVQKTAGCYYWIYKEKY